MQCVQVKVFILEQISWSSLIVIGLTPKFSYHGLSLTPSSLFWYKVLQIWILLKILGEMLACSKLSLSGYLSTCLSNWPKCRRVWEGVFISLVEFFWWLWLKRMCQWHCLRPLKDTSSWAWLSKLFWYDLLGMGEVPPGFKPKYLFFHLGSFYIKTFAFVIVTEDSPEGLAE